MRERYADFGPTFAHQKLTEDHDLVLSVQTLRGWLITAGLWLPRLQRARRSYPPRPRRACLGQLVQIDGSEHAWFEDRGPVCTLLVYVDDATSPLMELCFAEVESTFDYFRATQRYLERTASRWPSTATGSASSTSRPATARRASPRCRSLAAPVMPSPSISSAPAAPRPRPRRTGQRHPAGPARQGAAPARPPRSCRVHAVPARVHGRLQSPLRQAACRRLLRASAAAPGGRPQPDLHAADDAPNQPPAHLALQAVPLRARRLRRDPTPALRYRGGPGGRGWDRHPACPEPCAGRPPLPEVSRAALSRGGRRVPASRRGLHLDRGPAVLFLQSRDVRFRLTVAPCRRLSRSP